MIRRAKLESGCFLRWTLAFSALASIAACGSEAPEWISEEWEEQSQAEAIVPFVPRPVLRSSKEVPPELQAAYIRSIQEDAPESYAAHRTSTNEFRMANPAHRFDVAMDGSGIDISPPKASWSFSLRTTAVGCENALVSLAEPTVDADGNRVRYVRPGIEEWYLNGPFGIEQGFILDQAPNCQGTKIIQMKTGGNLHPEIDDADGDGSGESIKLVGADGQAVLFVSHLYVNDANGDMLPARMAVESGTITIHVDDKGATYPLNVDPLIAVLQQKIPTPGNVPGGQFGYGLAFSGETVLIGSPKSGELATEAGSAYVYVRNNNVWTQQAKLLPPVGDAEAQEWFGFSVALSGDTALVSAPQDMEYGLPAVPPQPRRPSGAVYVFVRNGTVWNLVPEAKLVSSDIAPGDLFGVSAALSGDTALIGAHGDDDHGENSGAAYLFTRTGGVWTQQQKLTASDGAPWDLFGVTVALSSDTAAVGAVYDDNPAQGINSGSMYLFESNGVTWVEKQKLTAFDGVANDYFGYWASISNDTLFVTAALHDHNGIVDSGAAYVFVKGASNWNLLQELTAPSPKANDWYGSHVAVEGNGAVVGAQQVDAPATNSGAAYWYSRSGPTWTLRHSLPVSPGGANENFGWTVGISGSTVAVGAPFDNDHKSSNPGSVYIFVECKSNGEACAADAECCGNSCVDGVCCDTTCGGGKTDDCQACSKNAGGSVDGTCSVIDAGVACRGSAGACDAAEACDGVNTECPADGKIAAGTECRAAVDLCDSAEECDGLANECPPDVSAPAGTECRSAIGACDVAETCNGLVPTCPPDTKLPTGTECRSSAGSCDVAEICDGASGVCPADGKFPSGVECRTSAGACDSPEVCNGSSDACPDDTKLPTGTQCRLSAGACDSAEVCDGSSNDCPTDTKLPTGSLCRASEGICDQPELCDGVADNCPDDTKSPVGVLCRTAADLCDQPETCDGINSVCPPDAKAPSGTQCRASAGICDQPETCNGVADACPSDVKLPLGQVCRLPKGLCDEFEFCDGKTNDCPVDQKTPAGIFCRAPKGLCDEPESCDGKSDACPTDKLTLGGILCRPAEGICDIAEACTGQSAQCPADQVGPAGTVCREQFGVCDLIETCDGKSPTCPDDGKVDSNIPCRPAGAETGVDPECDAIEYCGGDDVCPEDRFVRNDTPCQAGTKICKDGKCVDPPPPADLALYGGGPVCQTNPVGSSSSNWAVAFLAIALGSLRRRIRPSKH